jgi:hypothetical protein
VKKTKPKQKCQVTPPALSDLLVNSVCEALQRRVRGATGNLIDLAADGSFQISDGALHYY